MLAQLINWFSEISNYLPFMAFFAGLGGSLHCVGMCGGLVTASCRNGADVARYQLGRLLGYLVLGLVVGSFGIVFNVKNIPREVTFIPAVFIGLLFIHWGYQSFHGKRAELPTPKIIGSLYTQLWNKLVRTNSNFTKSFFTGLISILLPCGLLYGVILGAMAMQHFQESILSLIFFWLGTLPSMVIAPRIVQKLIAPFKQRLPKSLAVGLMLLGVFTVTSRVLEMHKLQGSEMKHLDEHICH